MTNASGRAVSALFRQLLMRRVLLAYAALSAAVAVLAVVHAGVLAGLCAVVAPALLCITAGGTPAIFFWGTRNQKLFGIACVLLCGAIAVWLAPGFSIALFGYRLGGPSWSAIGAFLGLLASRRPNWDASR